MSDIHIIYSDYPPKPYINKSLHYYLLNSKNKINNYIHQWNTHKTITNPYEYIHTSYSDKKFISKLKPVSRSFYKLIEIYKLFSILEQFRNDSIQTFHIAEGPGGFIEATCYLRKRISSTQSKNDKYTGITLLDNNSHITPNWSKIRDSKLLDTSKFFLESGEDNTGNLYNVCNLHHVYKKYKNSMHIITADGGFDFSTNYNQQEQTVLKLLLVQSMYAILCQKKNGVFIMKIFDNFNRSTNDIIYMLNCYYDNVYICKPKTSRYANSEKYVVCKHFKYNHSTSFYSMFVHILEDLENNKDKFIYSILSTPIDLFIIQRIQEINAIFGQQQIEIINNTISSIEHKKDNDYLNNQKKNNIYKCIMWFQEHNIPYYFVKHYNLNKSDLHFRHNGLDRYISV